ncbi:hypothetical protein [Shewanella woodyi]|uniref:CHRD domain-containing protein n=1 Tax=Shewanella woodyi (strain ATCC 51908 / MS32) TaxID=392500 RepID=B1KKC1_SHEWM|nr:hypothetical protein [Shewanella woodyi]ACA85761.1 hypothetical protein Swoo_1473 [Shewanella woodyi ATCC 51908]
MDILRKVLLISLVFLVQNAEAKYFTDYSSGVTINRIHAHSGGGVTLHITGEVTNLDNCLVTERVHIRADLVGSKNLIAHAMMAFASGKKVGLHASGCEIIPFWGGTHLTPIINNLWVYN